MSVPRILPAALAAIALAGCQPAPAAAPAAPVAVPAAATAGKQIRLRARYEAAAPAARRLQATVDPLTDASLDHVTVKLSVQDGAGETPIAETTLQQGEFDHEITFGGLKESRTYYARAYAYVVAPRGGYEQVSLDAGSYKPIVVGTDDRPVLETIVVQLRAVAFTGTATSSGVAIDSGPIEHKGNESVSLGS